MTATLFSYPRKIGTPRPSATYRGARRNFIIRASRQMWQGVRARRLPHRDRSRYTAERLRKLRRTRR